MSMQAALNLCPTFASKHQVKPSVHPQDFIFHFLIENKSFDNLASAVAYYFDDGARSAVKLKCLLQEICGWQGEPIKILEFASGYGCVTRHLNNVMPNIAITSCDIHLDAIKFITQELAGKAVISASVPEQLNVPEEYDIVFALSFFSHMPKATWTRWFNALLSKVKTGGFLVFTTHGWLSRKFIGFPKVDKDGFWFAGSSEQKDLDTSEYGLTLVTPGFVFEQASQNQRERIVFFREGYWWEHQDLYVVKCDPNR